MKKETKIIVGIGVALVVVAAAGGAIVWYTGRPKKSTGAAREAITAVQNNTTSGNTGTKPASSTGNSNTGNSSSSQGNTGKDYTGFDVLPAPVVEAYKGFKLKQEVIAKAGTSVKRLSQSLIDQGLTTILNDTDMGSIFFLGIDSAIIKSRPGGGFKYPFYEIPYSALTVKA